MLKRKITINKKAKTWQEKYPPRLGLVVRYLLRQLMAKHPSSVEGEASNLCNKGTFIKSEKRNYKNIW